MPLIAGRAVVGLALPKSDPAAFIASADFAEYNFESAPNSA